MKLLSNFKTTRKDSCGSGGEQFQLSAHKIYSSSSKTVDALMKLELPSGVEVEIKV